MYLTGSVHYLTKKKAKEEQKKRYGEIRLERDNTYSVYFLGEKAPWPGQVEWEPRKN